MGRRSDRAWAAGAAARSATDRGIPVRQLRHVSVAITILGVLAIAAALAFNLGAAVTLTGMLLVVAGLVKIVVVALWRGVAGFGAPTRGDDREVAPGPPH